MNNSILADGHTKANEMNRPSITDVIGPWTKIKEEILTKYAKAYSTILNARPGLTHIYIDAFAGSGMHLSKKTREKIPGSPLNALEVRPPFREYHFIDLRKDKIQSLKELVGTRSDVFYYEGDCNEKLVEEIFPKAKYKDYKRGLCILDPYGMHYNWEIVYQAGQLKTLDIFLNFPIHDMNRNVLLRRDPEKVKVDQIERMNSFWGDNSWKDIAYHSTPLFSSVKEKVPNSEIIKAYKERLKKLAGFKYVPEPIAMRNNRNAVIYYLFFASQKAVAGNIIEDIFKKYSQ